MFKNIFSKVQAFGKAVFTRIVGFIGGVIGIKPETVEVPAPPEIANDSLNNAPEKAKAEEEKGLTKAYTAVKKAASAAIKAGKQALIVSAQLAYMVAHFAVPFQILSLAWEYAQAQGLVAIFMGLWNMGTLPYFILCMAIVIGIGTLMITVETLWSALLYPIRRFLFPIKAQQIITVEPISEEDGEDADALYIISTVEKIVQRLENRLDERLVAIETMLKFDAPQIVAALEKAETEVVVDTRPATPVEVKPERFPVVIEIEETVPEVVDIRPTKSEPIKLNIDNPKELLSQILQIKDIDSVLLEYRSSDLKSMIATLNKSIPDGINKGNNRKDKKNLLIQEIKKQLQYFNKNVAVA